MSDGPDMYSKARALMVAEQLERRGIASKAVLECMGRVPRHLFVDESLATHAYQDGPLSIGHGQTISQPYMVALMTEALDLKPSDRVLEIGCGCGYQSAVLAGLCARVYAVERVPALFDLARANLMRVGVRNVSLKLGDGTLGWPEEAPFEAVLAAAYSRSVPEGLRDSLAFGGRLVMPVGDSGGQLLVLYSRGADGKVSRRTLVACRFVPLMRDHRPSRG
ncbi:MAG: protein-L-isoaspartate(D-aspartate) O-methyltransferase [Deltaproteobacteria bacterium]|jgi:protein-L-isoaspartate(D-aspartate) O-methyltransferase|nr:protein-L-isoaspartate(D-aspartate) O-methyltransferase [Deltaproteobacteria bacterium]